MVRAAHILLVEDNKMDVELTLDAFKEHHLKNTVQVVRSGEEALDYVLHRGRFEDQKECPRPDLILLDLKLPGISGLDVLREIKKKPRIRRIPVVVLTSSSDDGDCAKSYDLGANSYLVKPVEFDGFLGVIGTIDEYWLTLNVNASEHWDENEE